MINLKQRKILQPRTDKEIFFDDLLDLFFGFDAGHLGKYCYDGSNWDTVLVEPSSYYVPRADNDLVQLASTYLPDCLPEGLSYIDFGVGGVNAFEKHALPIISGVKASSYIGVDSCKTSLRSVLAHIEKSYVEIEAQAVETDFFLALPRLVSKPSVGVMNGLTLTNMYGTLENNNVEASLVASLHNLTYATQNGWLLVSVDENQDKRMLHSAYETESTSKLYLNVFYRMEQEAFSVGFDPSLFVYEPEWHPELQLFAHMARATAAQDFRLGDYRLHIAKGQKFHLLNSYKFEASFFEACCDKAGLAVQQVWHHETPMKLYLLKDKTCRL